MRPFHHRDPGPVGAALNDPRLLLEVINDGMHLDPQVVRVALAAAGVNRIALITDAMVATGMPNGRYMLGSQEVDVTDGLATLAHGSHSIAGSTLTMDVAYANAVKAGVSLVDASRMASTTPHGDLRLVQRRRDRDRQAGRPGRAGRGVRRPQGDAGLPWLD